MSTFPSRSANAHRLDESAPSYVAVDQAALQMLKRTLAARFTAMRQVGATPLLTKYWAEDANQGGFAVLEVLTRRGAADSQQVELFYQEAAAAALLQHPHISRASHARRVAETHFRVTELVRGAESLREVLMREGRLRPAHAGQIALQLSQALDFAHRREVLHLQLHPGNVLLDSHGEVIVSGFGIAQLDSLQWAQQLRAGQCPPAYVSPEQAEGGASGRASDLYALGMLLYEMLTDHVPRDEADLRELFRQRKVQPLRPPRECNPDISAAFSDLVMALLSTDPALRLACYENAEQFGALLRRACDPRAALSRATNPLPAGELGAELMAAAGVRQQPLAQDVPSVKLAAQRIQEQLQRWQPTLLRLAPWATLALLLLLLPLFWLAASGWRPDVHKLQRPALPSASEPNAPAEQTEAQPSANGTLQQIIPPAQVPPLLIPPAQVPPLPLNPDSFAPAPMLGDRFARSLPLTNTQPPARFNQANLTASLQPESSAASFSAPLLSETETTPSFTAPQPAAPTPAQLPAQSTRHTTIPVRLHNLPLPADPTISWESRLDEPPVPPPTAASTAKARPTPEIRYGAPSRTMKASFPVTMYDSLTGTVVVEVSVDKEGNVTSARALAGPRALRPAALVTARQWKFQPSTLNGVPIAVTRQITFHNSR